MRSRPFVVLFIAVFVATMGISMVSPLLPVYAEELGASGLWIGLTFSSFAISQTLVSPFAGQWSDRYGRKPFIIAGLGFYVAAAIGYLTADTFVQVMAFRMLSGCGTSLIFSVARAYIGDMVPEGHEGRWFGLFATADIVGFGIGPLLAGALREAFGFDAVFIGMGALMSGSALVVWLFLPPHPPEDRVSRMARTDLRFGVALRDRLVVALALLMGLTSLSFGATLSFLGLRLDELGIGPLLIGLAFSVESLASGMSQPLFGHLVDRMDRRRLVVIGLGISGGALIVLGLPLTYGTALALLFVLGVGQALTQVTASAMQVVAGRRVGMGTVIGIGSSGNGVGIVVGAVAGGVFADTLGLSAPFYAGGIALCLAIIVVLLLLRGVPVTEAELRAAG